MSFKFKVVSDEDFPELLECMWDTYEDRLEHYFRVFCPLNPTGVDEPNRDAAIKESVERFREWHKADPHSRWLMVIDEAKDNKVVAGCWWSVHEENPFEKPGEQFDAYWHPEGSQREYATQAFWQQNLSRVKYAQRPHLNLEAFFTRPEYQKRGIGTMMMQWGFDKAKELGVELWVESGPVAKQVYEKLGFTEVAYVDIKPVKENPDETWKAWEKEYSTRPCYVMWRPKDGPYVEGKSVKTWEEKR